jgi:hypothetical protein
MLRPLGIGPPWLTTPKYSIMLVTLLCTFGSRIAIAVLTQSLHDLDSDRIRELCHRLQGRWQVGPIGFVGYGRPGGLREASATSIFQSSRHTCWILR